MYFSTVGEMLAEGKLNTSFMLEFCGPGNMYMYQTGDQCFKMYSLAFFCRIRKQVYLSWVD